MKILHTPARLHPYVGGVERYVLDLAVEQVSQGHQVTVVCADEPSSEPKAIIKGVKIIRLPYKCKVANTNITFGLLRVLLHQDFDIIHTHIPTPWSSDVSMLASMLKHRPLIVTYHNDIVKDFGFEKLLAELYSATLLRLIFKRASRIIITQSKYLEYSKHLKNYKNKITTIPVGVSPPKKVHNIKRNPNQLFFLSVLDSYHEYKGLPVLLNSIVNVKKQKPQVKLVIGGKGDLTSKYERIAKDLGIQKSVKFLGFVPDDDLPKYYSSSAMLVLPSVTHLEGFGIVALEALSYGTPVITTSITGSSSFIKDKHAGLVVRPNEVTDLTKAIITLLNDAKKSEAMGLRGAKAVNKEFGWDRVATQLTEIYRGAVR